MLGGCSIVHSKTKNAVGEGMHEPDWPQSVLRYGGRLQAGRLAANGSSPDAPSDMALSDTALRRASQARGPDAPPPGDLHALAVRLYMLWNYE